jgi:hypothetical protein
MLTLTDITSACEARGGITHVWLLDRENVTAYPRTWLAGMVGNITSSVSAFTIDCTVDSAEYTCTPGLSAAGHNHRSELTLLISGGQAEVDTLIWGVKDKMIVVIFKDREGVMRIMTRARMASTFEIPATIGARQEYKVTFSQTDTRPAPVYAGTIP